MCRWFTSLCIAFVVIFISIVSINIEEIVKEDDELQLKRNKSSIKYHIENSTIKKIVFWSTKYDDPVWGVGSGQQVFKNCPEKRCETVRRSDADQSNLSQYDAFLFHGFNCDFNDYAPLPAQRYPQQVYVFVSTETERGAQEAEFYKQFKYKFFNYTITHRLDSDISWLYFTVKDIETDQIVAPSKFVRWRPVDHDFFDKRLFRFARGKKRQMMGVLSHCDADSNRDILIERIKKYMQFVQYGKCGGLKCHLRDADCVRQINTYKFYASFENSLCIDYMSEKVSKVLRRNLIPVIFSGAKIEQFLPPKSYINVDDFGSVQNLTNYLSYLSRNPREYIKYFWWKKYYKIEEPAHISGLISSLCSFCEFLHRPIRETKIYTDFLSWYMGENVCRFRPKIID